MNPIALTVAVVALFIALCVAYPTFLKVSLSVCVGILVTIGIISLSGAARYRMGRRDS